MIVRTSDATFLNELANHPEIRPFVGGGLEPLDLTAVCQNPANIILVVDGAGAWVLQMLMPGVYELHTMFLPEARGRPYFVAAKQALAYVFGQTDALEIVTKCPDDNDGARMAAATMGFRERFRREGAWQTGAGISYRVFSIDDWFVRDRTCLVEGRAFHSALEAAKEAQGCTLATHPDDEAHDRAVGAACLMIKGGRTDKAIGFYNRWAIFAGYATIFALSPTVIDVRDAIVEVRGGEIGGFLCRSEPPLQPSAP